MTVAALEARSLRKRYGRSTWALRDITLSIPAGGITALVGPNAAGKSTLIRTWMGFERPTAGAALVDGMDPIRQSGAVLRRIGYVPQSPRLYDALSVDEHLLLARQVRPGFDVSVAEERLRQLAIPIEKTGRELSGGQQAQVALSLALGTRGSILLLDEPLADLDPLARLDFLRVLAAEVRSTGATALLSSHVVSDVAQACDRIVILGVGHVLLHSTIEEALSRHRVTAGSSTADGAVACFVGSDGSELTLARREGPDGDGWRAASLEEVVLGYLTRGRMLSDASMGGKS